MTRPPRVLLAKPGLDGHDRGIKVVAMALRDAAADEDADLVGISSLSGAHLPITEQVLAAMGGPGAGPPLVIGGTIPADDVAVLLRLGVAGVFPVGTPLPRVVEGVLSLAAPRTAA